MSLISYDRAVIATQMSKPSVDLPEERIRGDTESDCSDAVSEYRESTELAPQQDVGGSSGSDSEVEVSEDSDSAEESVSERPMPILTDESEAKLKAEEPMVPPVRSTQASELKVSKTKVSEKTKEKSKPKRSAAKSSASKDKTKSDTIQLQHFSREAMDYVRHEIGESKRREHALEAYLYIKSGGGFSVSEDVMELVREYGGDKSIANMDARIARMETKLNSLLNVLYELELSMSYVLLDRAGLGGRVPATIKEIDLAGQASLDTREHLRISARDQQKRDSYTSGRPIR